MQTHVGKDVLGNVLRLDLVHDLHLELEEATIILHRQSESDEK